MTSPLSAKLGIGIFIAVLGGGASVVVLNHNPSSVSAISSTDALTAIAPTAVHTAKWYVAHPTVLKQDEMRCAGNAATISQASCQNISSADEQLTQIEMQKAAAENGEDSTVSTSPAIRGN